MARKKPDARGRAAWELAASQHGLVTRRQLLALGFTSEGIDHRIARGRIRRVHRGVYAVGLPRETVGQRGMAAVLACGDGAMLSHRSAAALWGIAKHSGNQVEVIVRRRSEHRRVGIRVRSRPSLSEADVTTHDSIPVTVPARTLLDLATELGPLALERAVNDADKRDLIGPEQLRSALAGYSGEPGVRALRAVLYRHTFRLSDSALEVLFRRIAATAGMNPPLTKQWVNGFEVDFHWPDLGLVVETDGLRYHRTPATQARDRLPDQTHVASGLTVLRFTHHQVRNEPGHVRAVLTRTARRSQG